MTDIYQSNTYRNGIDVGNYQSVFRKKTERINWKKLAAVDIDRVIQQNDITVLRDNIKHVAFCDTDAEMEIKSGDRTLLKMFKLAQLMIDYLLNSQEHLAGLSTENEERCAALIEETGNAKRKVQESEAYINDLKRECHRRKKLILAQQQIMDSGPETYHRCPYCEKAFLNGSFLQAHLEKRHGGMYIRSMYQIDSRREESPRRDNKHDFHSSSEKRIEELVRQFGEERKRSDDKAEELEKMRQMMEDMMRQQRDEMEGVINDLEKRLQDANRQMNKPRSYVGEMTDDRDDTKAQKEREEAVKKAISDRQRQKKHNKANEDKIVHQRSTHLSLDKALGSSLLAIHTLSQLDSFTNSADMVEDASVSIMNSNYLVGCRNNNDCALPDSYSSMSTTDVNTSSQTINSYNNFYTNSDNNTDKTDGPSIIKRQYKPDPIQSIQQTQVHTSPRRSPVRQRSPQRPKSPIRQRSPVQKLSPEQQIYEPTLSVKESAESISKELDVSDFDRMWEMNEQYRMQSREEVVNTLGEHLEHHGIKRTATGIPETILKEKLTVTDMEQRQLSIKYIDFGEIRKKLVVEVEREAQEKLRNKSNATKLTKEPVRTTLMVSAPSPMIRPKNNENVKRNEALSLTDSDWDDKSDTENLGDQRHNVRQEKEALRRNKLAYEEEMEDILRSPKRQSGQTNNARVSSELSNTMNSSLWGPSESKAVTSVPHPGAGNTHKSTNKSSDIGNHSDSFSDT